MTRATPFPWHHSPTQMWGLITTEPDGFGFVVAEIHARPGQARDDRDAEVRANAALIIKAVNSHEALVKALERAEAPHARGCTRPRNDPGALCSCGLDALLKAATP